MILYFNLVTLLLCALVWGSIVAFLRVKKKKSLKYLVLFTFFFIYIIKVLDYTLFQFQSLLILKHFMPNLMLRGENAENSINLVPLFSLTLQDVKTSLLNILLFVPFGLGLPFITKQSMKKVVMYGALFSLSIELLQLLTGFFAGVTFRVADVNDLLFNTIGAAIGYMLVRGFKRIWHP